MALKITCPSCGEPNRLAEPYPMPGAEVQCRACARALTISYPAGMVARLRARGVRFVDGPAAPPAAPPRPASPSPLAPPVPAPERRTAADPRTQLDLDAVRPTSPTVPLTSPEALLEPSGEDATEMYTGAPPRPSAPAPARPTASPPPPAPVRPTAPAAQAPPAVQAATPPAPPRTPARPAARNQPPRRSRLGCLFRWLAMLTVLGALVGGGGVTGLFWYYGRELPTVEALGRYQPPAVTVVKDKDGRVLGEIYEKRRYVVQLEEIPDHVRKAFLAAEDANFYSHDGIDYMGIVRAVLRNAAKGRKAQGASTITQQVARNFLLSSEKTISRKVKEILLARRIEQTFDKDHILYLYLNQIYLGSGAYGVEAAARTYFDKSVGQLTLAEAAILAGLPQRPSDYSPHQHWEKARARQEYSLGQMLDKGYIDRAAYDAALAEVIPITRKDNPFLLQAPWFTEHVRRYLVETYGFEKVYNDGLIVETTCDLDLQKLAQEEVLQGAVKADNSVGWRGPKEHIEPSASAARLETQEQALREELSRRTLFVASVDSGKGGYGPVPDRSTLEVGRTYEAIVLEVTPKHAVVGVGAHRLLIPVSWTQWAYKPNPERSFKSRVQNDLTDPLKVGDVVDVRVEGLSTEDFDNLKGYSAAGPGPFAAARLVQTPELQAALFAYRLEDGAVLSMVGGTDFASSEYNRAIQARRQVGSTFKPFVYATAVASKQYTVGSIVQDAPTVFPTLNQSLWKPTNYGEEYLGNITVRRALQMSRNVPTIRMLDKVGLEAIFDTMSAARIGFSEPSCSRTHIPDTAECAGTRSPSKVAGMSWCESCAADSCPMVKVTDEFKCLDAPQDLDGTRWCHSCDVNMRACYWLPVEKLPSGDRCVDERREADGQIYCRSCDLSMALGSSSLTMVELARAYSVFATYGKLIEPHFINRVLDRDGTVIEEWKAPEAWPVAMDPAVAGIGHWLLTQVTSGGTAAKAARLGLNVAGKTGTTNDFFDAWFVGYNRDILAATWLGYDQPRSIGISFTGGEIALPIWMEYIAAAVPKDKDRPFPPLPGVAYVPIDESTGRVANGGFPMPMLPNTAPTNAVLEVGQKTSEDLLTSDY